MKLLPIALTPEENSAFAADQECAEVLSMTMDYYGRIGYTPPWIGYLVSDGEKMVGTGGFKGAPRDGKVEIAYGTFESFRNKGIGENVCKLLVELALHTDPEIRVMARTLPERNYSARLLEKNGFLLLGNVMDEEDGDVWEWQYLRYPPLGSGENLNLETDRLKLRPTTAMDAAFLIELMNSTTFLHHIGDRKVRTLDDAKKYIAQRITKQHQRLGYSNYTIIRRSDSQKLGTCGLNARPGVAGIDIGYALLPQYEGKGYASEAAAKMLDCAFRVFKLPAVQAYTTRENIASQKILEKIGMDFKEYTFIPNDPEELLKYKLEAKEYLPK